LEGKYLHFQVEGESFMIPISVVEDIVPYSIVKNETVILRGAVISVVDIKEIFQFCKTEPTQKVIIVNNGETFGILVDNLVGIVVAEDKEIDQDLAIRIFGDDSPISGIIKKSDRYISVIDTEKLSKIAKNKQKKEELNYEKCS
jgi:chemotaxis signal transduction protein